METSFRNEEILYSTMSNDINICHISFSLFQQDRNKSFEQKKSSSHIDHFRHNHIGLQLRREKFSLIELNRKIQLI